MRETVVVIAAHPDDEALGCGGALARHSKAGEEVHAVFMTDGVSSRGQDADAAKRRDEARESALEALGIRSSQTLGYADNRMDTVPLLDVVQRLEAVLAQLEPVRIYTHHAGDLNVDHRLTHQAVMTACRPVPGTSVREILTFEVASSTDWSGNGSAPFLPNVYVDIASTWDAKIHALRAYSTEMRDAPHSRSFENIRAWAVYRGHTVGMALAEAFMLIRSVR